MRVGEVSTAVAAVLAAAVWSVNDARAQVGAGVGYHVTAGVSESDNIRRTPDDEKSETIATAGFDFTLDKRTRTFELDSTADMQWVDYLDNTFDRDLVGNFAGRARYHVVPERFSWMLSDNFGQSRIDPLAAVTPDNRENVNYFATGPDFFVPFGSSTRMQLGGRYSKVNYETSPLDSERYTGAAALIRDLSSGAQLSVGAQRESIDFDSETNPDYDRDQAYVRLTAEGGRTKFGGDVGYTRLENLGTGSNGGLMAHVEVSRQVSASSVIGLSAGRELADSGSSFRFSQGLFGDSLTTQPTLETAAPFTSNYVAFDWNFQRNRTGLGLNVSRMKEDYEGISLLDRSLLLSSVRITRTLTPTLRASLLGSYTREDFDQQIGDYDETGVTLGFEWRLGRRLSLNAIVQHYDRSSDLRSNEYTENRALLSLSWGQDAVLTGVPRPRMPSDSSL